MKKEILSELMEALSSRVEQSQRQEEEEERAGVNQEYEQMRKELIEKYPGHMQLLHEIRRKLISDYAVKLYYCMCDSMPESVVEFMIRDARCQCELFLIQIEDALKLSREAKSKPKEVQSKSETQG